MSESITYPLDLVGSNPQNKVTGVYNIQRVGNGAYFQFPLREGPFFEEGLELIHTPTGNKLRPNVDYELTYRSPLLTLEAKGKAVYAGILILNKKLATSIKVTAQIVGAGFSTIKATFIPSVVSNDSRLRQANYDQIVDIPAGLPPTQHSVATGELTEGFDDMVDVLQLINESIKKLVPSDTVLMENVVGLEEALAAKVGRDTPYKIDLGSKAVTFNDSYQSQIRIHIPPALGGSNIVSGEIGVSSDYGDFRVHFRGQIDPKGSIQQVWKDTIVRVEGTNQTFPIRCTYNLQHEAIIYLGDGNGIALGKTTVTFKDFTTSSPEYGKIKDGFKIFFTNDAVSSIPEVLDVQRDNSHRHQLTDLDDVLQKPVPLGAGIKLSTLPWNKHQTYYSTNTDNTPNSGLVGLGWPSWRTGGVLEIKPANAAGTRCTQSVTYPNGEYYVRYCFESNREPEWNSIVSNHSVRQKVLNFWDIDIPNSSASYWPVYFEVDELIGWSMTDQREGEAGAGNTALEIEISVLNKYNGIKSGYLRGYCDSGRRNYKDTTWFADFNYHKSGPDTNPFSGVVFPVPTDYYRSGIVVYVRGGSSLKVYSNATNVRLLKPDEVIADGVTMPGDIETFRDIPFNGRIKPVCEFFGAGHYSDIERWFSVETGGLSVETTVGQLGSFTVYPWFSNDLPIGFVWAEGQAFDKARFRKLAEVFPSGRVVDLRGRVLKGSTSTFNQANPYEYQQLMYHDHGATVGQAVLNRRFWANTTGWHGHGGRASGNGNHGHGIPSRTNEGGSGNYLARTNDGGISTFNTDTGGWHEHSISIDGNGNHNHYTDVNFGGHGHSVTIHGNGSSKNIIDNVQVRWIIKAG